MKRGCSGLGAVADEGARLGDGSNPVDLSRRRIARLEDLRGQGLRLASEGDIAAREGWYRQWTVLLHEIDAQLRLEAPVQAELVLWPVVDDALPDAQFREDLVRAAVGCRELRLLVDQIDQALDGTGRAPNVQPASAEAPMGATYVGGGRFEGAIELRRLIERARESLLVVDPYTTGDTFTLAAAAPTGISRRFLSSDHPGAVVGVTDAWPDWEGRWQGNSQCRVGSRLPHFRLLLVDGAAYHVDASLKDFGASFTFYRPLPTEELRRIEGEIESMWTEAASVELSPSAGAG